MPNEIEEMEEENLQNQEMGSVVNELTSTPIEENVCIPKKTTRCNRKWILIGSIALAVVICLCVLAVWGIKQLLLTDNVREDGVLYIYMNDTPADVYQKIEQDYLISPKGFRTWANYKHLDTRLKHGRYRIKKGMSTRDIVNMLSMGRQEPVNLIFNNQRTKEQLAGRIAQQLELDSAALVAQLNNDSIAASYGFTTETIGSMFVPNTYQVWWTLSVEELLQRMHSEYTRFWTPERQKKAQALGLTPVEVSVLASIVEQETKKNDEKPRVAGVYLNRLRIGMRLQADPTVIFATGDFTIRRVLKEHLNYDSPYNTYIYKGLPPGIICIPEISSIDAVLNAEQHNYIYFCAKPDFSGRHVFAATLGEHNRNAAAYRAALKKYLEQKQ